jgi:hypothetical protein
MKGNIQINEENVINQLDNGDIGWVMVRARAVPCATDWE